MFRFERGLCPRHRILGGGIGRRAKPPSELVRHEALNDRGPTFECPASSAGFARAIESGGEVSEGGAKPPSELVRHEALERSPTFRCSASSAGVACAIESWGEVSEGGRSPP